ncbi:hypothetical protein IFT67_10270 [Sphingomonas sp. CFBP 13728]|uniref:hypothetical protein n=1 Tax=Sphingomonas sp. CFBP 13728 TaxID=2775294 RepID=UPI00178764E2|nr:hypothetical protein [Sphingomonas sp. CFBP 13728]MBD8619304.1 hypothetical protein [Sphingomonas sp. CFBP 13728]
MIEHPNILPLTVVAAIAIFLAREILEAIRRFSANRRKRHALRLLLAAECERNQWVIKWMREKVKRIETSDVDNEVIQIDKTATGYDRFNIIGPKGTSSAPIPTVKTAALDRYLFEAASVDAKLFGRMEDVVSHLATLAHLREGLIDHVSEGQEWLKPWAEYAREELADVELAISTLYKACTGKSVTPHQVR